MTVTAAMVLFVVIWFLALFVALPIRIVTQDEAGHVVPGTPGSAPAEAMLRRKMVWVTLVTLAIWGTACAVILWGGLTVDDIDLMRRL